jgi:Flp pilus assembly protein TadG
MRTTKRNYSICLRNWQRGTAAIEMALFLPILILMVDGVLEFGWMLHNQSVLTSASSIAARAGIAQGSFKLDTVAVTKIASDYCVGNLISFSSVPLPIVTVLQAPDPVFQKPLQVTVSFAYQGILVGGFFSALQINPLQTASAVMYNE